MENPKDSRMKSPEVDPSGVIPEEEAMFSGEDIPEKESILGGFRTPSKTLTPKMGKIGSFVENHINYEMNGSVSFETRPWLPRIYESEYIASKSGGTVHRPKRRTILKTARQCEKSTSIGNKIVTLCAVMQNCTCLFVSSSEKQAQEFASERLNNVLRVSPGLRGALGGLLEDNKFTKRWSNNSRALIRSVNYDRSPTNVRGVPADVVVVDEIQGVNPDHIPVITSVTNNSSLRGGPIWMFAGTPLTSDNYVSQTFHKASTKNYWLTRCGTCRHWTPPFQSSVSKRGMICERCGRAINPLRGEWVSYRTRDLDDIPFEGYHLSRAIMPYTRIKDPEAFEDSWESFYTDFTNPTFSEGTIANELFGLEHDSGRKPITREQLLKLCHPSHSMSRSVGKKVLEDPDWPVFMGVDWGEGSGDGAYTVVTLGVPVASDTGSGEMKILVTYMKRYQGSEAAPDFVKKDIVSLFLENQVTLAFADAGHGWGMMDYLWDNIPGGREKVYPVRYRANGAILAFNETDGTISAHRTRWMARVFSMLQRHKVILPKWEQFESPFSNDFLSIFVDRSDKLAQSAYRHAGPDDSFHSMLYMMTALLYYRGELDEFLNA